MKKQTKPQPKLPVKPRKLDRATLGVVRGGGDPPAPSFHDEYHELEFTY